MRARLVIRPFNPALERVRAAVKHRTRAFNSSLKEVPRPAPHNVLQLPSRSALAVTDVVRRGARSRRTTIVHQRAEMAWWMRAKHAMGIAQASVRRRRHVPPRALLEVPLRAPRFVPKPRSLNVHQATDVARLAVPSQTIMIAHALRAPARRTSVGPSTMAAEVP